MDLSETLSLISIFSVGYLTYFSVVTRKKISRTTTYASFITKERNIWRTNLRRNIATFCGLTHHWTAGSVDFSKKREQELLAKIDNLRYMIPLQLTREKPPHKKIIELIKSIPDLTDRDKRDALKKTLDSLEMESQNLLKFEWEEIKKELKVDH